MGNPYNLVTEHLAKFFICVSIIYMIIFWSIKPILSFFIFPCIIGYVITIILLRIGFYDTAKFNLLICLSIGIIYFSSMLSRETGIQILFIPLSLIPLFIFSPSDAFKIYAGVLISFVGYTILEISNYSLSNINIFLSDTVQRSLSTSGYYIVMIPLFFYVHTFIKKSKEKSSLEKKFFKSEIKTLKKMIVSLNHIINNHLMLIITNATVIQQRVNTPEVAPLAQDIKAKGYEISKLLKKLSKLKKPVDTEYAEGITMLDIDASEYESDEALDKTPAP